MLRVPRWIPLLALATSAACATAAAPPPTPVPAPEELPAIAAGTVCDPEEYEARSKADRFVLDSAYTAEPQQREIRVVLRAPEALVRRKVLAAMLACNMPVAQSSDDVITAEYGSHMGFFATYTIHTSTAVVGLDDSTTLVRLSGREARRSERSTGTSDISNKDIGGARRAWLDLRNVAKQLRADPELRVDLTASTPLGIVYSR